MVQQQFVADTIEEAFLQYLKALTKQREIVKCSAS